MADRPLPIYILLLFALLPFQASAELYRWVDENGKTHFSDSPPNANAEATQLNEQTNNNSEVQAVNLAHRYPTQLDGSHSTRTVVVTDVALSWEPKSQADRDRKFSIGRYFFGRGCASPTAMVLPDAKSMHD